jgi:hypothetical protein
MLPISAVALSSRDAKALFRAVRRQRGRGQGPAHSALRL